MLALSDSGSYLPPVRIDGPGEPNLMRLLSRSTCTASRVPYAVSYGSLVPETPVALHRRASVSQSSTERSAAAAVLTHVPPARACSNSSIRLADGPSYLTRRWSAHSDPLVDPHAIDGVSRCAWRVIKDIARRVVLPVPGRRFEPIPPWITVGYFQAPDSAGHLDCLARV